VFSPRDLDGEPYDPYVTVAASTLDEGEEEPDVYTARQSLSHVNVIDLCRTRRAAPNSVNILVVADLIFHWDANDNFIQPTTINDWHEDVKGIMKSYPSSTTKTLYTNWDSTKFVDSDVEIRKLRDIPIDEQIWVNMPSFQEKYGNQSLVVSGIISAFILGTVYFQSSTISDLSRQIAEVNTSTPRSQNFTTLQKQMQEQKDFMRYRHLMPLITKDVGNAIQKSGMKIQSMEISSPKLTDPPQHMIVTIRAENKAYNGWLQEEPIAKALLAQSVTMSAIRRPTNPNVFVIEGLLELEPIAELFRNFQGQLDKGEDNPS